MEVTHRRGKILFRRGGGSCRFASEPDTSEVKSSDLLLLQITTAVRRRAARHPGEFPARAGPDQPTNKPVH